MSHHVRIIFPTLDWIQAVHLCFCCFLRRQFSLAADTFPWKTGTGWLPSSCDNCCAIINRCSLSHSPCAQHSASATSLTEAGVHIHCLQHRCVGFLFRIWKQKMPLQATYIELDLPPTDIFNLPGFCWRAVVEGVAEATETATVCFEWFAVPTWWRSFGLYWTGTARPADDLSPLRREVWFRPQQMATIARGCGKTFQLAHRFGWSCYSWVSWGSRPPNFDVWLPPSNGFSPLSWGYLGFHKAPHLSSSFFPFSLSLSLPLLPSILPPSLPTCLPAFLPFSLPSFLPPVLLLLLANFLDSMADRNR